MEATLRYKRAISAVREMYMLIGYIYRSDDYTPQAWEPVMMNHYLKLLSHDFADEIKAEIMSGTSSKSDVRFRLDSIFNELGNLRDELSFFTRFKTFGEDTLLYNSLAGVRGEAWAHEIIRATDEVIKVANARISGVRGMLESLLALYYNTPPTKQEECAINFDEMPKFKIIRPPIKMNELYNFAIDFVDVDETMFTKCIFHAYMNPFFGKRKDTKVKRMVYHLKAYFEPEWFDVVCKNLGKSKKEMSKINFGAGDRGKQLMKDFDTKIPLKR